MADHHAARTTVSRRALSEFARKRGSPPTLSGSPAPAAADLPSSENPFVADLKSLCNSGSSGARDATTRLRTNQRTRDIGRRPKSPAHTPANAPGAEL